MRAGVTDGLGLVRKRGSIVKSGRLATTIVREMFFFHNAEQPPQFLLKLFRVVPIHEVVGTHQAFTRSAFVRCFATRACFLMRMESEHPARPD